MKTKILITAISLHILSGLFSASQAAIYSYIDENGNQHFSEHKVNKNYKSTSVNVINRIPSEFNNGEEKDNTEIKLPNRNLLQKKYHPIIVAASDKYHLEPEFIHAVITAESAYRHQAVSSAGAKGLMQLMPATAQRFGVSDTFDAKQSIFAGTSYLRILLNEFKTKELALAAYNAGEGTVRRYNHAIPPYPETQNYVVKVMKYYHHYKTSL